MWPFTKRPPYTAEQCVTADDPPEFKRFLEQRFCEGVNRYGRASDRNGAGYSFCRNAVIILSAVTTVLISAGFRADDDVLKAVTLAISFLVTVMSTLMATFNYRDKWIAYRAVHEDLLHQLHTFRNGVGDYENRATARRLFVARVEETLERANIVASGLQVGAAPRDDGDDSRHARPDPDA
jgi:hypothetical protein